MLLGLKAVKADPRWPGGVRFAPNFILPTIAINIVLLWILVIIEYTVRDVASSDKMETSWGIAAVVMMKIWILILETIHLPIAIGAHLGVFANTRLHPVVSLVSSIFLLGAWGWICYWYLVEAWHAVEWIQFGFAVATGILYIIYGSISARAVDLLQKGKRAGLFEPRGSIDKDGTSTLDKPRLSSADTSR